MFNSITQTYHYASYVSFKEPSYQNLGDLLSEWNPDDVSIQQWGNSKSHPSNNNDTIAYFNYLNETQLNIALEYRNLEIPFVINNIPSLQSTVTTWTNNYLVDHFKNEEISVEVSKDNHFIYHTIKRGAKNHNYIKSWTPPQNK
eukprot:gene7003-14248_t